MRRRSNTALTRGSHRLFRTREQCYKGLVPKNERAVQIGPQTLLFTDIEGSTRLARKLGDGFDEALDAHHRLVRTTLSAQGGQEIDAAGDGFFFAFARAQEAIRGAVEAQRALGAHPWPDGVVVKVRIGIHTGDTRVSGDRHSGVAVHRAARIAAVAQGGQILLSHATHTFLDDDEAAVADLDFTDLGEHLIKDFDRPVRLYQVRAEGLETDFPAPSNGARASATEQALTIRLLGPLDVERAGVALAIAGQKQRAVLALLALRAGEVVPTEMLIDRLWGESPPRTAPTSLQNAISQLRKALGAESVVTRPRGYALAVDRQQVDAHRFEALLETVSGADAETRLRILREALPLWRGPPLADFTYEAFAQGEIARLEELRLAARRGTYRRRARAGSHGGRRRGARVARRAAPAARAAARPAHARALPLGPPGRGA